MIIVVVVVLVQCVLGSILLALSSQFIAHMLDDAGAGTVHQEYSPRTINLKNYVTGLVGSMRVGE